MEYSAQRVRSKTRDAVRRREDQIEQEEIESGELNLIPYLDMVTNLMLFLLASISAGIILTQIDTTLPDKAPPPVTTQPNADQNPDDQPLKLVVSITRDRMFLWSISRPRGHADGAEGDVSSAPATMATRATARTCARATSAATRRRSARRARRQGPAAAGVRLPRLSNALFEIANRRYAGKQRKADTYQIILHGRRRDPVQHDRVGDGGDALQAARVRQGAERLRAADRRSRASRRPRIRSRPTAASTTRRARRTTRRRWRCSATSCSPRGSR